MSVEQLIYTDRPRGKGVDPSAAGYQVTACSPGLDAEARKLLASICLHYGDAVYRAAPREALDGETAWRSRPDTTDAVPVPDEVLRAFPVIWSYDRLRDDLYALTRVCYLGRTHDGRFGNFLAHALAFAPAALGPCDFNPLALSRTRLFRSDDPGDETVLPALSLPEAPAAAPTPFAVPASRPYRERLEGMVAALGGATPSSRPAVLCIQERRQAEAVVEALLGLLPPAARRRTTFCTGEADRTWLPSAAAGRPAGVTAAHHLLVLVGPDARALTLRADECQSVYAVFNFVGNQFSDVGAPGAYASFAAACALDGEPERLRGLHAVIERLGLGDTPPAWDALVPAAGLAAAPSRGADLTAGTTALAGIALTPDQARPALDLLAPHVEAQAAAGDAAALRRQAGAVGQLVDRLPPEERRADAPGFLAGARAQTAAALRQGRARAAAALLDGCGGASEGLLLAVLGDLLAEGKEDLAVPAAPEEASALVDLLVRAAERGEGVGGAGPPAAPLLVLLFRAAARAGRAAAVWAGTGARHVRPRLAGATGAAAEDLTRRLIAVIPAEDCPDAAAWLSLRLLELTRPKGEALVAALVEAIRRGARGAEAGEYADYALRLLAGHGKADERAVAVGRVAEAAHDAPLWGKLFAAYGEAARDCSEKERAGVRRRLAEAGAAQVLCAEVLSSVLPWEGDDGSKRLQRWRDDVAARPAVLDALCHRVAALLRQRDAAADPKPLARHLLKHRVGGAAALAALGGAAVMALPLAPLPKPWEDLLGSAPDLPPDAAGRLRVLHLLGDVERRGAEPGWSPASFPHGGDAWARDLRQLPADEQRQAIDRCLASFNSCGVTSADDALGLVRLLGAAGQKEPDEVASAAATLLAGRDPVTCVVAVMAFARGARQPTRAGQAPWPAVVTSLLGRLGKGVRRLFAEHLEHRFRRPDPEADGYEDRLREAVGLPPRKEAAPAQAAAEPGDDGGLLGMAKSVWGRLTGRRGRGGE